MDTETMQIETLTLKDLKEKIDKAIEIMGENVKVKYVGNDLIHRSFNSIGYGDDCIIFSNMDPLDLYNHLYPSE